MILKIKIEYIKILKIKYLETNKILIKHFIN